MSEHLDPDPEMHTTRELLEHIHALLAQIGEMHDDTGRLRAELDALRSEADQVATVGLTWKREAERLRAVMETAIHGWGVWHADDEEWIGWGATRKLAMDLIPDSPEYEHLKIREATALIELPDQQETT